MRDAPLPLLSERAYSRPLALLLAHSFFPALWLAAALTGLLMLANDIPLWHGLTISPVRTVGFSVITPSRTPFHGMIYYRFFVPGAKSRHIEMIGASLPYSEEEAMRTYQPGKQMDVYYLAADPSINSLDPAVRELTIRGFSRVFLFTVAIGIFFVGLPRMVMAISQTGRLLREAGRELVTTIRPSLQPTSGDGFVPQGPFWLVQGGWGLLTLTFLTGTILVNLPSLLHILSPRFSPFWWDLALHNLAGFAILAVVPILMASVTAWMLARRFHFRSASTVGASFCIFALFYFAGSFLTS